MVDFFTNSAFKIQEHKYTIFWYFGDFVNDGKETEFSDSTPSNDVFDLSFFSLSNNASDFSQSSDVSDVCEYEYSEYVLLYSNWSILDEKLDICLNTIIEEYECDDIFTDYYCLQINYFLDFDLKIQTVSEYCYSQKNILRLLDVSTNFYDIGCLIKFYWKLSIRENLIFNFNTKFGILYF